MFIGHFGLGFAAKRAAPGVSLVWLFAATQLADLLWPIFVAAGVEHVSIDPGNTAVTPLYIVSYPYLHSLVMLIVWAAVLGWLCQALRRDVRSFASIAAIVVSHWGFVAMLHS